MDIFFLSFDETNREKNWWVLKSRFPQSRRIHGVKGLALAHQMCAHLSNSPFFFVLNGDSEILPEFQFEPPPRPLQTAVYVWRSLNPVNQLIYGFGGVKLFPRSAFSSSCSWIDLSTSLKVPYKIIPQLASVTRFNVSPLEAWRGAFRECVKLSSGCVHNQKPAETGQRLNMWCEKAEKEPFSPYVLLGAQQGREYGQKFKSDPFALKRVNDFSWLKVFFFKNAYGKA